MPLLKELRIQSVAISINISPLTGEERPKVNEAGGLLRQSCAPNNLYLDSHEVGSVQP